MRRDVFGLSDRHAMEQHGLLVCAPFFHRTMNASVRMCGYVHVEP
jgi:hypothetical protein